MSPEDVIGMLNGVDIIEKESQDYEKVVSLISEELVEDYQGTVDMIMVQQTNIFISRIYNDINELLLNGYSVSDLNKIDANDFTNGFNGDNSNNKIKPVVILKDDGTSEVILHESVTSDWSSAP